MAAELASLNLRSFVRLNPAEKPQFTVQPWQLVRFPTMTEAEVDMAATHPLVAEFAICRSTGRAALPRAATGSGGLYGLSLGRAARSSEGGARTR